MAELLFVVVFGRHDCKIHGKCELARAALVVSVVAGAALGDFVVIRPVFRAVK